MSSGHRGAVSAAVIAVAIASGCRIPEAPLAEVEGGAEVGVRCGAQWSHVKVRPPHIIGPAHNLRLDKNHLRGSIAGLLVNVRIEAEGFTGMIASRPVEVWFGRVPGQIAAEGTWFGASVRLSATDDSVRATVPRTNGSCCSEFVMERSTRGVAPGYVVYEDRRSDFQYRRLEVPSLVHGWYSTPEITLLMIALMFTACG